MITHCLYQHICYIFLRTHKIFNIQITILWHKFKPQFLMPQYCDLYFLELIKQIFSYILYQISWLYICTSTMTYLKTYLMNWSV